MMEETRNKRRQTKPQQEAVVSDARMQELCKTIYAELQRLREELNSELHALREEVLAELSRLTEPEPLEAEPGEPEGEGNQEPEEIKEDQEPEPLEAVIEEDHPQAEAQEPEHQGSQQNKPSYHEWKRWRQGQQDIIVLGGKP